MSLLMIHRNFGDPRGFILYLYIYNLKRIVVEHMVINGDCLY